MTKRQLIFFLFIITSCKTSKKINSNVDSDFYKSLKIQVIKGTGLCNAIYIANGVVIRNEEVSAQSLQHIEILRNKDAYKAYGDIGANGAVIEKSNQIFDYFIPSSIELKDSSKYVGKRKLYFLNGYLITNDSLKISKNAIKKLEILDYRYYDGTLREPNTVLINIWIYTEDEVANYLKNCRRSF